MLQKLNIEKYRKMNKFVSWRRVSTAKQGMSGLGLEAQMDIIEHFVRQERGELIADFCEVYTGTELSGCKKLQEAISYSKKENAILVIAKTDRFRNTAEALKVFEEMGDGNIYFCDLPHSDKFTLTLFFALAEREAQIVSIRTKAALKAKKDRGEAIGGTNELWGKNTGADRNETLRKAREARSISVRQKAMANRSNIDFLHAAQDWEEAHGAFGKGSDWKGFANRLNERGKRTSSGLEYTPDRARRLYPKIMRLYYE